MSSPAVYDAFKRFLSDQFRGVYPVIDFDDIEPALGQSDQPFIVLEEMVSDEVVVSIGNPDSICMREEGSVLLHCFTPAPEASASARRIAEQVRQAIQLQFFDGVRIVNTTPPDAELYNEGLWAAGAVAVAYTYDAHYSRPGGI